MEAPTSTTRRFRVRAHATSDVVPFEIAQGALSTGLAVATRVVGDDFEALSLQLCRKRHEPRFFLVGGQAVGQYHDSSSPLGDRPSPGGQLDPVAGLQPGPSDPGAAGLCPFVPLDWR